MQPDQTWRLTQGRNFFPDCWGQHVGWTMSFRITVFQVSLFVSSSCSECCPVSVWFQSGTYEILVWDVFVQYFPPKERSFTKGFNVEKTSSIYDAQPPKFCVCEKKIPKTNTFSLPFLEGWNTTLVFWQCIVWAGRSNDISWVSTENRTWLIPQTAVAWLLWLR